MHSFVSICYTCRYKKIKIIESTHSLNYKILWRSSFKFYSFALNLTDVDSNSCLKQRVNKETYRIVFPHCCHLLLATHPYESEAKNWLRLDEQINGWRRRSSLRHVLRQLNEASAKCAELSSLKDLHCSEVNTVHRQLFLGPKWRTTLSHIYHQRLPTHEYLSLFQFGTAELMWAVAGG